MQSTFFLGRIAVCKGHALFWAHYEGRRSHANRCPMTLPLVSCGGLAKDKKAAPRYPRKEKETSAFSKKFTTCSNSSHARKKHLLRWDHKVKSHGDGFE